MGELWGPVFVAYLAFAFGIAVRDARSGRLDDALTLPFAALCILWAASAGQVWPALAGAAVWSGLYFGAALVRPGSLGGGDVKLAIACGALAGACGPLWLSVAVAAAGVFTVPWALVRGGTAPHGPAMLAATTLVLVAS